MPEHGGQRAGRAGDDGLRLGGLTAGGVEPAVRGSQLERVAVEPELERAVQAAAERIRDGDFSVLSARPPEGLGA